MRNTRQKEAIRSAFLDENRPLSPDEVLVLAQNSSKSLSIATVYRNIHSLIQEQWLELVEIPGRPPRYEVAGKEHHHHFLCQSCNGAYELSGCCLPKELPVPPGFIYTGHEFFVFGICPACDLPNPWQQPACPIL